MRSRSRRSVPAPRGPVPFEFGEGPADQLWGRAGDQGVLLVDQVGEVVDGLAGAGLAGARQARAEPLVGRAGVGGPGIGAQPCGVAPGRPEPGPAGDHRQPEGLAGGDRGVRGG